MATAHAEPNGNSLFLGKPLMSNKTGRNDLCPCGSGDKMKNCHPRGYGTSSKNRSALFVIGGIAALVIVAVVMTTGDTPLPPQRAPAGSPINNPSSAGTPQPGPAPEGKEWSVEHGHWHDAPVTQVTTTPVGQPAGQTPKPLTPQPDGPVPEGKAWNAEHGHWHDDPTATKPSPEPASVQPEGTGP
jgi:hypothetical protein